MEQKMEDRKANEKHLHHHLRGELADDRHYTSNKKFYSITQSSRDYVQSWLAERCRAMRALDYC
jgi:hypothetical protein